jgi:hypothetical protein
VNLYAVNFLGFVLPWSFIVLKSLSGAAFLVRDVSLRSCIIFGHCTFDSVSSFVFNTSGAAFLVRDVSCIIFGHCTFDSVSSFVFNTSGAAVLYLTRGECLSLTTVLFSY